jgi:hypothetical protein
MYNPAQSMPDVIARANGRYSTLQEDEKRSFLKGSRAMISGVDMRLLLIDQNVSDLTVECTADGFKSGKAYRLGFSVLEYG